MQVVIHVPGHKVAYTINDVDPATTTVADFKVAVAAKLQLRPHRLRCFVYGTSTELEPDTALLCAHQSMTRGGADVQIRFAPDPPSSLRPPAFKSVTAGDGCITVVLEIPAPGELHSSAAVVAKAAAAAPDSKASAAAAAAAEPVRVQRVSVGVFAYSKKHNADGYGGDYGDEVVYLSGGASTGRQNGWWTRVAGVSITTSDAKQWSAPITLDGVQNGTAYAVYATFWDSHGLQCDGPRAGSVLAAADVVPAKATDKPAAASAAAAPPVTALDRLLAAVAIGNPTPPATAPNSSKA